MALERCALGGPRYTDYPSVAPRHDRGFPMHKTMSDVAPFLCGVKTAVCTTLPTRSWRGPAITTTPSTMASRSRVAAVASGLAKAVGPYGPT